MRRLDQFARDRKVEHCSGTTCDGGLMRRAATTPISRCNLSSTLVCRNLGNFALCVNLTKNSGELNSRKEIRVASQFFYRRSCVRQCDADHATAGEIDT